MSGFAVHPHRASRRCSGAECRVDGTKTTEASEGETEMERWKKMKRARVGRLVCTQINQVDYEGGCRFVSGQSRDCLGSEISRKSVKLSGQNVIRSFSVATKGV